MITSRSLLPGDSGAGTSTFVQAGKIFTSLPPEEKAKVAAKYNFKKYQ